MAVRELAARGNLESQLPANQRLENRDGAAADLKDNAVAGTALRIAHTENSQERRSVAVI